MNNLTPQQIQANLDQFTGTEQYHKWSILFPNHRLTDGAKYVAEKCGAYWIFDLIASHHNKAMKHEVLRDMQVWKLTVNGNKATIVCEDGNNNKILQQKIPYTDFPLPEITLWVQPTQGEDGKMKWIIFLPSEY